MAGRSRSSRAGRRTGRSSRSRSRPWTRRPVISTASSGRSTSPAPSGSFTRSSGRRGSPRPGLRARTSSPTCRLADRRRRRRQRHNERRLERGGPRWAGVVAGRHEAPVQPLRRREAEFAGGRPSSPAERPPSSSRPGRSSTSRWRRTPGRPPGTASRGWTRQGLFDVRADGHGRTRLRRAPWIGWPPGVGKATWSPAGDELAFEEERPAHHPPDGRGLKTLAERGTIELLAWVPGAVPADAQRAASLPLLELASTRLLRSRGRIRELVAAGAVAGVVSSRSKLDCAHVLAWSPRAAAVARASPPAPCDLFLPPRETLLGGLRISGARLSWSGDWSCGNTECDRVNYDGVVRSPRRMAVERKFVVVTYDGPLPPPAMRRLRGAKPLARSSGPRPRSRSRVRARQHDRAQARSHGGRRG